MANEAEDCGIVDEKVDLAEIGRSELKEDLARVCDYALVHHLEVAATSTVVPCETLVDSDVG